MSYTVTVTLSRDLEAERINENGLGVRVFIDDNRPASIDSRIDDQIRVAVLGQAAIISQWVIEHEMVPGDELPGAAQSEPLFAQAVLTLRSAGAFDEDIEEVDDA